MKKLFLLSLIATLMGQMTAAQVSYAFATIDVLGASSTQVRGINNSGTVVGIYTDSNTGLIRGFRLRNGKFIHIDFPGAMQTYPRAINNAGQVAGFFFDSVGIGHGFLLVAGTFQQIDYPGAPDTVARSLNNKGRIGGDYVDVNNINLHGFVLSNQQFISFDFPGAVITLCTGINDLGERVGTYSGNDELTHSYLFRNGNFKSFDVAGSSDTRDPGTQQQRAAGGFLR